MNFRDILRQLLTANPPDPRQGGGFVPNYGRPLPKPQLPPMAPAISHGPPMPRMPAMPSHGDMPSYGPPTPPAPPTPSGPLASPISPLGPEISSSIAGSGLPPTPKPSLPPVPPSVPIPSVPQDSSPIGSTTLGLGGSDIEGPPPLDPGSAPISPMADGLPGQGSMRLTTPVEPLARNNDLVSLIQKLLHKR